jgi:hypothetical protein
MDEHSMPNFKAKTILLLLLNFPLINLAQAQNAPGECPDPKIIQQQKWLGEINCSNDHCLYTMGGIEDGHFSFGTKYYWHFYIDHKIYSSQDIDFAKSKMVAAIETLVYQSGPTEGGDPGKIGPRWDPGQDRDPNLNYTCFYSNSQGAIAKAVVTNVRIHPDDYDDYQ